MDEDSYWFGFIVRLRNTFCSISLRGPSVTRGVRFKVVVRESRGRKTNKGTVSARYKKFLVFYTTSYLFQSWRDAIILHGLSFGKVRQGL